MVIDEWSSCGYIQEVALQHPMKCKDSDQIWEDGILHEVDTNLEHDGRRHPHLDEWVWMVSKGLVSHLQIYETRQYEAWPCWLLLKEFGHYVTYPFSKGMLWFEAFHGTHMIWQHNIWFYGEFYKSIIMMLLHDLYDDGVRRQQELMLLWKLLGEYGLILLPYFA